MHGALQRRGQPAFRLTQEQLGALRKLGVDWV
ncbi:hypothetical protein QF032_000021 [Streptomyces achromogenes]|nr:hypothetical protein [Streptomyces achromogenes]